MCAEQCGYCFMSNVTLGMHESELPSVSYSTYSSGDTSDLVGSCCVVLCIQMCERYTSVLYSIHYGIQYGGHVLVLALTPPDITSGPELTVGPCRKVIYHIW